MNRIFMEDITFKNHKMGRLNTWELEDCAYPRQIFQTLTPIAARKREGVRRILDTLEMTEGRVVEGAMRDKEAMGTKG